MSKQWKPNSFKYLEEPHINFTKQQEKKLDADHNGWRPRNEGNPPINGEYAIPLEEYIKS